MFLAIFAAANLSAWRLRQRIAIRAAVPLLGALLSLAALAVLLCHTGHVDRISLAWIGGFFLGAILLETLVVMARGQRPRPASTAERRSQGASATRCIRLLTALFAGSTLGCCSGN